MEATRVKFDVSQWKDRGAVYGFKNEAHLFWGAPVVSEKCQQFPMIYSNDFFLKEKTPWTSFEHHKVFRLNQTQNVDKAPNEISDNKSEKAARVAPEKIFDKKSAEKFLEEPPFSILEWENPDKNLFEKQFQIAQQKIKNGSLKKIVLTTETRARKTLAPDVLLSSCLAPIPEHTHLYGIWSSSAGFVGFTPEILFTKDSLSTLQTVALAGTSAKELIATELFSAKNRHEHNWVVEDIVAVLRTFGDVSVGDMHSLELRSLAHLRTPITVNLKTQRSFEDIILALHPTPAVGIAPRTNWKQIEEWRPNYGSFGAPFVVSFSAAHAVGLVGIRQLAWDQNNYYIRSGCGVVRESEMEKEWDELLLKLEAVKKSFSLKEGCFS